MSERQNWLAANIDQMNDEYWRVVGERDAERAYAEACERRAVGLRNHLLSMVKWCEITCEQINPPWTRESAGAIWSSMDVANAAIDALRDEAVAHRRTEIVRPHGTMADEQGDPRIGDPLHAVGNLDPGPAYMVTGYGETEFPEVLIARNLDEVADAYCRLVFGEPFADVLPESQNEADDFTKEVERHDWAEEPMYDSWTFEIGGVKVERVYARQFGGAKTIPSQVPLSDADRKAGIAFDNEGILDALTDAEIHAEEKRRNPPPPNPMAPTMKKPANAVGTLEEDPLYDQAVQLVQQNNRASISLVQRHLRIGYNRAARLLEEMERRGILTPIAVDGTRQMVPAQVRAEEQKA